MWSRFLPRGNYNLLSKLSVCRSSKRWLVSSGKESFIRSTILIQEGQRIDELPLIINKSLNIIDLINENKLTKLYETDDLSKIENSSVVVVKTGDVSLINNRKKHQRRKQKNRIEIETEDGTAVLFGKNNNLSSNNETFQFVDNIIAQEINGRVALRALNKIINLENNNNQYDKKNKRSNYLLDEFLTSDISNRNAILKQLIDMIIASHDSDMILEAMIQLSKDKISPSINDYRDKLCNEAILRTSNNQFSLIQLVDVVRALSLFNEIKYKNYIDDLWMGIKEKETQINTDNLIELFKILSIFDKSREILLIILEKNLLENWWKLSGSQLSEIILSQINIKSNTIFEIVIKWMNMQFNSSPENEIIQLIKSLTEAKLYDLDIDKCIEKYLKDNFHENTNYYLISTVMDYCKIIQFKNPVILKICANYLTLNAFKIPESEFTKIFLSLGYLNYQFSNETKFWQIFEEIVARKFTKLHPNDVLDILLSTAYMNNLSKKLSRRIFTLSFIKKIDLTKDPVLLKILKDKIQLIDKIMSIEFDEYMSDYLPDYSDKTLPMRSKLKRILNLIRPELIKIAGGNEKLSKSVILGQIPLDFYIIDAVIHSSPVTTPIFSLNTRKKYDKTAVLIHLPENYCRNSSDLVGPQIMRTRHLRKLGFRVMTLNYKQLLKLSCDSKQLLDYLSDQFNSVHSSP